jgi:hypothetical protein
VKYLKLYETFKKQKNVFEYNINGVHPLVLEYKELEVYNNEIRLWSTVTFLGKTFYGFLLGGIHKNGDFEFETFTLYDEPLYPGSEIYPRGSGVTELLHFMEDKANLGFFDDETTSVFVFFEKVFDEIIKTPKISQLL